MKKLIFAITCLLLALQCSAEIIVVEPDGSGDQPTIQAAIDAAYEGDEVVLSIGTFTGDGNRDIDPKGKAITIRSTNPDDPNIVAATIIDCNGSGLSQSHGGFYFHSGEDANTILNGLTITNGYAEYGGAIFCKTSSPAITNCMFSSNSAGRGGAIYNCFYSNPVITNCAFSGNSAEYGGAIYNGGSNSVITNCTFIGNSANQEGGATYNYKSNSTVTNCTFTGNSANQEGGAMHNAESNPTITNCTFTGSSAEFNGGAICNSGSNSVITNCTFTGNVAEGDWVCGGAIYNDSSNPAITNCTFSGNSAEGYKPSGGAMYNYNSEPIVTNCSFTGNSAYRGGAISNGRSNPAITNCTFSDNSAGIGGAMHNNYSSSPTITNCTFSGNSVRYFGGAIYNVGSNPAITNCTFIGNSAEFNGGAIYNYGSNPAITNCTFSGNSAESQGGAVYNYYGSNPVLTNCILWGNVPDQIYYYSSSLVVTYSDVQGGWGGVGNIDEEPLFIDPCNGDYHLFGDSPCIDAGDPNYAAGPNETDLDGNPRVVGGRIDMGAYEAPLGPLDLLIELSEYIDAMNLHKGTANSLKAKLNAALRLLEDDNENNDVAAVNLLEAFINAIEAQYDKKIPAAEADILIAVAQEIIWLLGG
jgi:predicted outer membrane repeat protein